MAAKNIRGPSLEPVLCLSSLGYCRKRKHGGMCSLCRYKGLKPDLCLCSLFTVEATAGNLLSIASHIVAVHLFECKSVSFESEINDTYEHYVPFLT